MPRILNDSVHVVGTTSLRAPLLLADELLADPISNTCRSRKLKCDEATPICQRCKKAGRYCDRARKPLRFRNNNAQIIEGSTESPRGLPPPTYPHKALQAPEIAKLFAHYIAELAPWYDLSDASTKFGTEVLETALRTPLLFSAVIALSAIHVSCTTAPGVRSIAEFYHGCCVRMLIAVGDDDELLQQGVALAATCLLRSYEILDEDVDPNRHLQGAYSLASYQSLLLHEPDQSLLTAGFWNYLREDITFSLFEQCPLKMDLDAIPPPQANCVADQVHLNAISLILGQIINAAFSSPPTDYDWLTRLKSVQEWRDSLPKTFEPFSRLNDDTSMQGFPTIHMLRDCHTAAMHYHLVSLSILVQRLGSDTETLKLFPQEAETKHLTVEGVLEQYALDVCGCAFTSNTPPVLVNAFGPIMFCARYIRTNTARNELKRHLAACKIKTGWPVERLTGDLETYWRQG